MNFSETIATLNNASAFELYRLRAAIDRVLDQPGWMDAVRSRLRVGQAIQYFDPAANRSQQGQVLELRRKQAVVLDLATQKRWLISYAAINLEGADVEIREKPRHGLGRNEVAIGDVVGFLDRNHEQRSGRILRLNDKTVTLLCGQQEWRVAYGLLHRVVDASASPGEVLELDFQHDQIESASLEPYGSYGNGAAMRVAPAGLLAGSIEEAVELSDRVTGATHNHPEGLKGGAATACAIVLARQRQSAIGIREFIAREFGYDMERTVDDIRPGYVFNETCQRTVPEALICALEATDFEDAIRNAISIGGDSDTVGAITGGVAEDLFGIPEDIAGDA